MSFAMLLEENVGNELIKTINKKDGVDAALDLTEAFLDTQISDELLGNIPLLGLVVKLKNLGYSISDYYFIKKLQKFIFHLDEVSKVEREEFFQKLSEDSVHQTKVNDNLLLLLNASGDIEKPSLIGVVFSAYVRGSVSYEHFMQFSSAVNSLNSYQLKLLKEQNERLVAKAVGHALASHGLVIVSVPTLAGSSTPNYYLNDEGALFLCCLFGSEVEWD
ncbi:hypothetical protein [Vibrio sp. 10N.237.312.B06]|uniref:hypothetical protein n=1 Tax=Vibrio sp. 10N.237.312.B06 TaxID=3229974 RepID=UPI00354BDAD9